MKKKFVLADKKMVFEDMEALSAELVRLAESGYAIENVVIGSYVGVPEINTSIAVNINGKTKRMNKSSIKWTSKPSQAQAESIAPSAVPEKEQLAPEVEDFDADDGENNGICSFCNEKWVRKTVIDGFDTFLCNFHLQIEAQLAKL